MSEAIGFVGLGMMGSPMVRRLAGNGQSLMVYDLDRQKALVVANETGAVPCETLAQMGEHCTIVVTMLPNSSIVRSAVLTGSDNLCAGLQVGAIVVDMSSSDPLATRQLGVELDEKGLALLDAPVSGGVKKAVSGSLAIILGGDNEEALRRVEPLLAPMGTVYRTGPLGSGHAAKALNNYVSAAGLTAACEALHVGAAFGLNPEILVDVLNASTGRNNSTENKLKQYVLNGNFAEAGFSLQLMAKDVSIASDLAVGLNMHPEGMLAARDLWRAANEKLGPGADHTEVYKVLAGGNCDRRRS